MVLPAWRTTTNAMASNDVRCPDVYIREDEKQHMQQLAEMAGNSAFLFKT